jgi:PAS domain S-box-containing protein
LAGDQFGELMVRGLLEAAPDAMVIVGVDGRIVLVNGQTEHLFGYERRDLLGQPIEILVPDRFRAGHPAHRQAYFADVRMRPMGTGLALQARRKDGSEFPAEISLAHLRTEDGMLVTAAIRDVTERHKADDLRLRLASIVDFSADAIISKTLDGVVTSWNHGAERIFGYSADEMIGRPIATLIPEARMDEEARVIAQLKRGEVVEHFETQRRRADGRIIDVSVTLSAIRDSAGNVVAASKVARDISGRKQAERAMERAKEAAETANRELEAFSYSVAHDLRAPLRGIDGFSQALFEDYGDVLDATGKGYIARVRQSALHMAELIDDLLTLARVTQGEVKHDRVDLSAIARTAGARVMDAHPGRSVELVVADGISAEGDARLLAIVFDNLLGNAWKFTGKRASARIEFGCAQQQGPPTYFVRDNGAGFDMAYSKKLFGVFQRLHGSGEFEGTGIGLATVERIIRRHGGRVWAQGEVDRGATFFFTLGDEEKS